VWGFPAQVFGEAGYALRFCHAYVGPGLMPPDVVPESVMRCMPVAWYEFARQKEGGRAHTRHIAPHRVQHLLALRAC